MTTQLNIEYTRDSMDTSFLKRYKLVPVVVLNELQSALPTLDALSRGGIKIAEITFRTSCAEEAIRLASQERKDMLIGAGTVINEEQCERAIAAGAKFIVSPGFSKSVFEECAARGAAYLPGVATATEIMAAMECGINVLKFFPAGALGGIKALSALAAAFPSVKFMPTGGVTLDNAEEYLSKPFVVAVGGTWLVKPDAHETERLAAEAAERLKI